MGIGTAPEAMTTEEIVALNRAHTFFSWSVQGALDPIAIDRAEGVCLYTPEGQRILDFNSQLMSVNIGHGDRRVIDAITEQATKLQYVQPAFATEIRAGSAQKLAEILPGDLDKVFFTLGGAEAIENAIKLARHYTGRYKVLARYRAYHGATMGAMTLTGDPRAGPTSRGSSASSATPTPTAGARRSRGPSRRACRASRTSSATRAPHTIAAVFLETIVGTNGILIPPDGYLQGVREICDRHGILMVCDEVMAGFGRTGRWFAVDHWDVVPDLMTMAKGLTSSYLPLGAVAMRHHIAEAFETKMFYGGLTYSSHPVSLAAALATIGVYEEDGLIDNAARLGDRMREHHERLAAKHPSRRGDPQPRAVRDPRPRPEPRPVDAADAVQRHLRRDEGDRQVLPRERPVHDDRQQLDPHEPAAVHHRGRARRGLRDHRRGPRHRRPGGHRLTVDGDRRWRHAAGAPGRLRPSTTLGRSSGSSRSSSLLLVVWETAKFIGGDRWHIETRSSAPGSRSTTTRR